MEYRQALKRPRKGLAFAFFASIAAVRLLLMAVTSGGARWAAGAFGLGVAPSL